MASPLEPGAPGNNECFVITSNCPRPATPGPKESLSRYLMRLSRSGSSWGLTRRACSQSVVIPLPPLKSQVGRMWIIWSPSPAHPKFKDKRPFTFCFQIPGFLAGGVGGVSTRQTKTPFPIPLEPQFSFLSSSDKSDNGRQQRGQRRKCEQIYDNIHRQPWGHSTSPHVGRPMCP